MSTECSRCQTMSGRIYELEQQTRHSGDMQLEAERKLHHALLQLERVSEELEQLRGQVRHGEKVFIGKYNIPPFHVSSLFSANAYFNWTGCGFGQLSFSYDSDTGRITASNESMGRKSVRELLHAFADFIADRAVLLDNPEDVPPIDSVAELRRIIHAEDESSEG